MLILLTTRCEMGCKHCISDCTKEGIDMTFDTLKLVCERIKEFDPKVLVISGGEPTSHPKFKKFLKYIHDNVGNGRAICVCSNGINLEKEYDYVSGLMYFMPEINFQITNVPELYPQKIDITNPIYKLPNVKLETSIQRLYPLGRAVTNSLSCSAKCSGCFNTRLVRAQLELNFAHSNRYNIHSLLQTMEMSGRFCTMPILPNGKMILGESVLCTPYADISMSEEEIMYNMKKFKCNTCDHINRTMVDPMIYNLVRSMES